MTEKDKTTSKGKVLVIGGGISGLTTAIEAAEVGYEAIIVEKEAFLGGRVARTYKYFPKLCPPNCGLEINFRRIKANPRIEYYTMAEVQDISGEEGNFTVTVKIRPRYVNQKCTACGDCESATEIEIPNEFNLGIDKTKAAFLPYENAMPMKYVIDAAACKNGDLKNLPAACKYEAIDLDMQEETITLHVGAVVLATGWRPYDATKIDNLGYGRVANVLTNVMIERYASPNGPTAGKIVRPSDGKEPKRVAFAQCAGSRDENHLHYCSSVCCLASLKQFNYIRELYPDAEVTMYYIDIRALGRLEDFLTRMEKDDKFFLKKGKVAKVEEDPATKNVIIEVEDTLEGKKITDEVDLLVLATGMEPNPVPPALKSFFPTDSYGFAAPDKMPAGMYACGVAKKPTDVSFSIQDATGTALKAIQSLVRR